jgi:FixJ family two-component response regulator
MPDSDPTVFIVDDDPDIRESLKRLLRSVGLDTRLFASASAFLEAERPSGPACIILDVRLPGQSGLDFQRELTAADIRTPIIFITAHGDIPMSVQAMKAGAIEFLTKPFRHQDLIHAIRLGLALDHARLERQKTLEALQARFQSLTPREREIMIQVVQGRRSKQIADDFGIAEATVMVHRCNLMRKMNVSCLPELGQVAAKLDLVGEDASPIPALKLRQKYVDIEAVSSVSK